MKKRFIYILVAIVATLLLDHLPALSFMADRGIVYDRSYMMDQHLFQVVLTDLKSGVVTIDSTLSVNGLWICYTALWVSCLLVLLCFFSRRWRLRLTGITIGIASAYYALFLYYVIRIVGEYYPTIYPNIAVILPAIVIQMMILVRSSIIDDIADQDEAGYELF